MFKYTKRELDDLANETKFQIGPLEKSLRLLDVLRVFNSHPVLKDQFVLKGGTALNFFHLEIPRLSVDVDLNYIGELEKDPASEARKQIESIIPGVFSGEYKVEQTRTAYALLQYKLAYSNLHGGPDTLKLDLNFIERISVLGTEVLQFDKWDENLSFPNLNLVELLAGKTRAFLTRYTPRDLYDLYRINKLGMKFEQKKLHDLFLYALLTASESHSNILPPNWSTISPTDVTRNLQPMLIRGEYPDIQSMNEGAKQLIEPMITLTEEELEIFDKFDATGEIKLDLIVRDTIVERISKSPAFKWKQLNLKQRSA